MENKTERYEYTEDIKQKQKIYLFIHLFILIYVW